MNKQIYKERRTFSHYDAGRFMLYLNEKREEYIPQVSMPAEEPENLPVSDPVMGYSYEGEEMDGGTLIEATAANYEAFVNGLIRRRYTQSEVEAIQSNVLVSLTDPENERATEFRQEWEAYQVFRETCKNEAKAILNL